MDSFVVGERLMQCGCAGFDFKGLPTIDFEMKSRTDDGDLEHKFTYKFTPTDYMLFPKIDHMTRSTYCTLSLWNRNHQLELRNQPTMDEYIWDIGIG